jgi:hypothetical protein
MVTTSTRTTTGTSITYVSFDSLDIPAGKVPASNSSVLEYWSRFITNRLAWNTDKRMNVGLLRRGEREKVRHARKSVQNSVTLSIPFAPAPSSNSTPTAALMITTRLQNKINVNHPGDLNEEKEVFIISVVARNSGYLSCRRAERSAMVPLKSFVRRFTSLY